jgi:hypothetical protein
MTRATSQLEHALWALRRGFRVFPLGMGSKKPNAFAVPNGVKQSTTDEAQVRRWWTKHPNGNVGIHGGVIVDCDTGIASLAEAQEWRAKVGLPATLAVRTGRRTSYGIQFHYTGATATGPYELRGVSGEVRSGNTYGLASGSIHPDTGQRYEVVIDLPRAAWPADCQLEKTKAKLTKKLRKDPVTLEDGEKIKPSFRQYWLVSQCGRLRRTGLAGDPLVDALKALRDEYCENPEEKTDDMLRQIAESGERNYGVTRPMEKDAVIAEFNARFYVIENLGGKCRVCEEVEDTWERRKRIVLVHQSFADFRNRYMHQLVKVGTDPETGEPIYESYAKVWLYNNNRRQYQRVVYLPETLVPEDVRNLWRGFAYPPVKGNCSKYLAHLKNNICGGKQDRYDWLLAWMAYGVRHPAEPGHTCPVLKGGQGVGKTMAAETYARLWGAHALTITQKSHFTGHFNAHLRNCSVLVANEAFFAGDRSQAGAMKGLITDEMIAIEAKGIDVVMTPNLLHILFTSNEDWVVPADLDVRRFTVFEVGDRRRENLEYFSAIAKQMEAGGYSALLYHLLFEADLKNFSPRKHLPTDELLQQKEASLTGADAVWYECLQRGNIPAKREYMGDGMYNIIGAISQDDGTVLVRGQNFVDWANSKRQYAWSNLRTEHVGYLFGANTRGIKPGMNFKKEKRNGVNFWLIPTLLEARARWSKNRFAEEWPTDKEETWTVGE